MLFKITFKNITHTCIRTSPFLLQRKSLGLISINVCDVNVGAKFYSYFFCDGENEELQWEVHIAVTDGYMNTDLV